MPRSSRGMTEKRHGPIGRDFMGSASAPADSWIAGSGPRLSGWGWTWLRSMASRGPAVRRAGVQGRARDNIGGGNVAVPRTVLRTGDDRARVRLRRRCGGPDEAQPASPAGDRDSGEGRPSGGTLPSSTAAATRRSARHAAAIGTAFEEGGPDRRGKRRRCGGRAATGPGLALMRAPAPVGGAGVRHRFSRARRRPCSRASWPDPAAPSAARSCRPRAPRSRCP